MTHTAPTAPAAPTISDPAKRVLRTLVQVGIPSFLSLAAGFPTVVAQAGGVVSPRLEALLVSAAAVITATATALAWIMANPLVNGWLQTVGLAGHSSGAPVVSAGPADSETTAILLADVNRARALAGH